MFLDEVKERTDFLFAGLIEKLSKTRILPNHLTALSFIFGLGAAAFVLRRHLVLAGIFLTLHYLGDIIDGRLARLGKKVTKLGQFLDITSDTIVRMSVVSSLFYIKALPALVFILLLLADILFCGIHRAKLIGLKTPPIPIFLFWILLFGLFFEQYLLILSWTIIFWTAFSFILNFFIIFHKNKE